jgi:TPR repeat protein
VDYLSRACDTNHAPSCFNLAVMFNKGDAGVPPDAEKFAQYKGRTDQLVAQLGGLGGTRTA